MTKREFTERFEDYGVNRKKLDSWLKKDWIPGAVELENGEYFIPEPARPPYTKTRARGGLSVYRSIIRGCAGGYGVFADLFQMPEERFQIYVNQLRDAGYILAQTTDGITYYEPSLLCLQANELSDTRLMASIRQVLSVLSPAIEASTQGSVSALLSHAKERSA